jgi:hypothetical protein
VAPAKPHKEIEITSNDVGQEFAIDEKDIKAKKPVVSKKKEKRKEKVAKLAEDKPEDVKVPEVKPAPTAPQPKVEVKAPETKPAPPPASETKPATPAAEAKPGEKKKTEDLDALLDKLESDLKS